MQNDLYKQLRAMTPEKAFAFVHECHRKAKGAYSINRLCQEAKVSQSTLYGWRDGKSIPQLETQVKLYESHENLVKEHESKNSSR